MSSSLFSRLYLLYSNISKAYTIGEANTATFDFSMIGGAGTFVFSVITKNVPSNDIRQLISESIHSK